MNLIKCPNCGCEYLAAEIFYPNQFLGTPKNIEKDEAGKLIYFNGADMDTTETYVCDNCNRKMTITAKVQFDATVASFNSKNSTKFTKPALFMNED